MKVRMSMISSSTTLTDLMGCDLIIEAVYEDMELKKKIFKELDKIAKPFTILATNTSALDINEIALQSLRPDDVIGLHFFSPANVMKLLEIVRAKFTSDVVVTAEDSVAITASDAAGKVQVEDTYFHGECNDKKHKIRL